MIRWISVDKVYERKRNKRRINGEILRKVRSKVRVGDGLGRERQEG